MPRSKPNPDMFWSSDVRKTANRGRATYKRKVARAEVAATKRAAAAKKGAEGPKKSQPGGYAASYPKPPKKKKYDA